MSGCISIRHLLCELILLPFLRQPTEFLSFPRLKALHPNLLCPIPFVKSSCIKPFFNFSVFATILFVSWIAYRKSDTLLKQSLDNSSPSEEKVGVFGVGRGPVTIRLRDFSGWQGVPQEIYSPYLLNAYTFSITPNNPNIIGFTYYDVVWHFPWGQPHQYLYVFVPDSVKVKKMNYVVQNKGNIEFVESKDSVGGKWYIFLVKPETTLFVKSELSAYVGFDIVNPNNGAPFFVRTSSLAEIVSDDVLGVAAESILLYFTSGNLPNPETVATFFISIWTDIQTSNYLIILTPHGH